MSGRRPSCRDVSWHVPGRKTPVAYSTKASSDLIAMLLAGDCLTFAEAFDAINFDDVAHAVVAVCIERGYGDCSMREMGSPLMADIPRNGEGTR